MVTPDNSISADMRGVCWDAEQLDLAIGTTAKSFTAL
jgi:hypothetical protein